MTPDQSIGAAKEWGRPFGVNGARRVQLHSSHHDYGPVIKRVPGTCLKNLQSDQSTGRLCLLA
jgi:hypothetical protein